MYKRGNKNVVAQLNGAAFAPERLPFLLQRIFDQVFWNT